MIKIQEQLKDAVSYCVNNNHDEVLRLLIKNSGCNRFIDNKQFLKTAVKNNSAEMVKLLLQCANGARSNNNDELLCEAVRANQTEIAKALVKYGANPKACNNSPLLTSFKKRNYEMANFLIKKGADPLDERLIDIAKKLKDQTLFNLTCDDGLAQLRYQ